MKNKPEPKQERRFGVWWRCESCEGNPEYEHEDFIKHLHEVHEIDTEKVKYSAQMTMHMDGPDWFSSTYDCTIGNVKAVKQGIYKRDMDDPMSMMHA